MPTCRYCWTPYEADRCPKCEKDHLDAISHRLQRIARLIDKELKAATGERVPWSLYTWGGQRAQYVSNTDRDQAKVAMQECLDRWTEPQDPPPHQGFS